jgi:hypothetical protein
MPGVNLEELVKKYGSFRTNASYRRRTKTGKARPYEQKEFYSGKKKTAYDC